MFVGLINQTREETINDASASENYKIRSDIINILLYNTYWYVSMRINAYGLS